ncbi:hypothetical protein D210916BOD24_21760 [Alteromonas sp. D210916BOD_24]|uniref:pseudouridine synthase n=1 Tax=Alteromonas sp. D210916BOD_24 TaxID=3157618 RepID=UPI00399CEC69
MLEIQILFEDDNLIVVNKPSGIAMHDAVEQASDVEGTEIASAKTSPAKTDDDPHSSAKRKLGIVSILKSQLMLSNLYLCHRLDTGTSGCLCLAKNSHTAAHIGDLFATRQVNKYYLALSHAKPKKKQGTIIGDMKNRRGGQRILLKSTDNPAITQFFSQSVKPGLRGFVVKPHSGKTHQIRVALKSIGAPLLGDALYGGDTADRLYLHAWHLHIPLDTGEIAASAPLLGGSVFTEAPVQQWFQALNKPLKYNWPTLSSRYTTKHKEAVQDRRSSSFSVND